MLSSPPFVLCRLAWAVGLVWGSLATTLAQTAPPSDATATLKEVVISSSRSEQTLDDLPLSVEVLTAQALEEGQVRDIHDLAKNLPNVSVKRAPARFSVTGRANPVGADGNAGFGIRGQSGNRVVMLVDGVRLPRSYINGSNAFGRDAVAVGLLKQVEVVHGPTSVLYGSDGLAGLVNFITLEPADFLISAAGTPQAVGGKAWLGYSGDDQGTSLGATVAARASDTAQWSLSGTASRALGLHNMGTNDAANVDRTTPNPQNRADNALLGKLVLRPSSTQRHALSLEYVNRDGDVRLLSNIAKPPLVAASVVDERATQTMQRSRLTWDARYQLGTPLADQLQTALSWQDSKAQDNGQTTRSDRGVRIRQTSYNEGTWQGNVQAQKSLQMTAQWSQKLTYGVDYVQTDTTSFADGSDPAPLAAFTPKKYFPDTRESSQALYLQSEWISEAWSITPGVRLDRFAIDVLSQDGYFPTVATAPGKSLQGSALSPKLGVLFRATPQWSVYGNYTTGFKAPEGQQLNSVYEPPAGVFARLLPNPDLKPEESRHLELGVRARLERLSLDVAVFTGQYTNLIIEKKDLGTANGLAPSAGNPTLFQTVNIDKATLSGLEIRGAMAWGQVAGGALSSPFSYGQTRGTNDTTGRPLGYIDPAKLTAGLKYDTAGWSLGIDVVHRAEKDASQLETPFIPKSTTQLQFTTPAATTLDLSGQWRMRKGVRLNWAINNLTDRKYWNWSDVQGLASNATPVVVDAYTQAGRHLKLTLVADF